MAKKIKQEEEKTTILNSIDLQIQELEREEEKLEQIETPEEETEEIEESEDSMPTDFEGFDDFIPVQRRAPVLRAENQNQAQTDTLEETAERLPLSPADSTKEGVVYAAKSYDENYAGKGYSDEKYMAERSEERPMIKPTGSIMENLRPTINAPIRTQNSGAGRENEELSKFEDLIVDNKKYKIENIKPEAASDNRRRG